MLSVSLILFIYAMTEGNYQGWSTGGVLAPLIISIMLMPAFGFIETKVAEPLIPPKVWALPAFLPLFLITMKYVTYALAAVASPLDLTEISQRISLHERCHLPGVGGVPAGVGHLTTRRCG